MARVRVEAARHLPGVDRAHIVVAGGSQGDALAPAAAAFAESVAAALIDVPFLGHFRRATDLTDALPYAEISRYLAVHRDQVDAVSTTLSYMWMECI